MMNNRIVTEEERHLLGFLSAIAFERGINAIFYSLAKSSVSLSHCYISDHFNKRKGTVEMVLAPDKTLEVQTKQY